MVRRFDMHSRLDTMAMAACIMSVSPTDRFNQSVSLVSLSSHPLTISSLCLSLSYKYLFCNAHFQRDLYGYTGLDKRFATIIHESD